MRWAALMAMAAVALVAAGCEEQVEVTPTTLDGVWQGEYNHATIRFKFNDDAEGGGDDGNPTFGFDYRAGDETGYFFSEYGFDEIPYEGEYKVAGVTTGTADGPPEVLFLGLDVEGRMVRMHEMKVLSLSAESMTIQMGQKPSIDFRRWRGRGGG